MDVRDQLLIVSDVELRGQISCLGRQFAIKIMKMDFSKKNILLEVPQEIFELICDQLPILSVMTLELVSKTVHERLCNSMVWKKKAEKITRKFKYQPLNHMMKFLKEKGNASTNVNTKLYKIVIGKYNILMYLFMFPLSLSINYHYHLLAIYNS